jgi:hypothetical protein
MKTSKSGKKGKTMAQASTGVNLDKIFAYQPKYEELRNVAKMLAAAILRLVPAGAEQAAAIGHVHEALKTASAAIALDAKL